MRLMCYAEKIKSPSQSLGAGVAAAGLSFYTGHPMLLARLLIRDDMHVACGHSYVPAASAHVLSVDSCDELLGRIPSLFSGHLRTGLST